MSRVLGSICRCAALKIAYSTLKVGRLRGWSSVSGLWSGDLRKGSSKSNMPLRIVPIQSYLARKFFVLSDVPVGFENAYCDLVTETARSIVDGLAESRFTS
jgi:hypothetical protein